VSGDLTCMKTVLLTYQVALTWVVVPLYADRFGAIPAAGTSIADFVKRDPAPLYANLPVRAIPLADCKTLRPGNRAARTRYSVGMQATSRSGSAP